MSDKYRSSLIKRFGRGNVSSRGLDGTYVVREMKKAGDQLVPRFGLRGERGQIAWEAEFVKITGIDPVTLKRRAVRPSGQVLAMKIIPEDAEARLIKA
jgi:hypothetical protein